VNEKDISGPKQPNKGLSTVRKEVRYPLYFTMCLIVFGILFFVTHPLQTHAKEQPGTIRNAQPVAASDLGAKPTSAPVKQVAQADLTTPKVGPSPSPTGSPYNSIGYTTPVAPTGSNAPQTVTIATEAPTESPADVARRDRIAKRAAADEAALNAPLPESRNDSTSAPDKNDPATYDVAPPDGLFLAPGTTIPITLEVSIDSTVQATGFCSLTGHTTRDPVLDFFKRVTVLLPYTSACGHTVAATIQDGQARIGVVWDAFLLPNGHLLKLDAPGTDRTGTMGFGASIDEHQRKALARALVFSVISAGAQLAQPRSGGCSGGYDCNEGFGQSVAQSFGTQFQQLATESYQRAQQTQPTAHVSEGSEVAAHLTAYLPVNAATP
jgi:type IV secretory pathway VirB10-like protein